MAADASHDRLRALVERLPEAVEDWPWGSVPCKVAGKTFVGWSRGDDGMMSVGFRTTRALHAKPVSAPKRLVRALDARAVGGARAAKTASRAKRRAP